VVLTLEELLPNLITLKKPRIVPVNSAIFEPEPSHGIHDQQSNSGVLDLLELLRRLIGPK
jgi:hypothetical protein